MSPGMVRWDSRRGPVPADGDRRTCAVCRHGDFPGESLNSDGTCPYAALAHAENLRRSAEGQRRELAQLAGTPRERFLRPFRRVAGGAV